MDNRLEDFIQKNKKAFDDQEPSAALWKRLEKKIHEREHQPALAGGSTDSKLVKVNWWKWAAAAMILITAGVLSKPYWKPATSGPTPGSYAYNDSGSRHNDDPRSGSENTANDSAGSYEDRQARHPGSNDLPKDTPYQADQKAGNEVKEELFHYARLIEIKQKEIATLKNNYPELFEQFSKDLTTLDNSFAALKHKYDEGLNSEQLLSAMIENLKLQTELLNRQLEITKKLKQQKNEPTYKNI
ncbi:anti-sigma factor [Niabella sp. CC-SYL272]|uniref:anti-sigma factor n=1 Tax=Niabella agricola TaxID=2891571 RepID=UPI001F18244B|nr:anti-sigma factor [Niabella agricola]MCF3109278.1 anti-sigma factor [Niabella agricola]